MDESNQNTLKISNLLIITRQSGNKVIFIWSIRFSSARLVALFSSVWPKQKKTASVHPLKLRHSQSGVHTSSHVCWWYTKHKDRGIFCLLSHLICCRHARNITKDNTLVTTCGDDLLQTCSKYYQKQHTSYNMWQGIVADILETLPKTIHHHML